MVWFFFCFIGFSFLMAYESRLPCKQLKNNWVIVCFSFFRRQEIKWVSGIIAQRSFLTLGEQNISSIHTYMCAEVPLGFLWVPHVASCAGATSTDPSKMKPIRTIHTKLMALKINW